jgi:hypothetical protein
LVLLQKFYDLDNETVDAEILKVTEQAKKPQDITIPLFSENTTRILAQDQKQAYALNQIVDAMANTTDHISYSSAEALLLDYIQAHPIGTFWDVNWWTCSTWGIALLYVGFVAFGVYYYSRSQVDSEAIRRLTLVIAGTHMLLPKAEGYGLKGATVMTTMSSSTVDLEVLKDQILTYVEHAQSPLIILGIVTMIGLIYYVWNSLKRRSFVYMDIGSGTKQILLRLDQLPNSTQNFTLTITTTEFTVRNFGLFAIITLGQPWKIRNVTTNERTDLRKWTWVTRRQNNVLTEIMAEGNPRVLALFVHTHNFEYVRSNRGHVETEMTTV